MTLDEFEEKLRQGLSPTIFVMPTYPEQSLDASVFYAPPTGFYAGVGIFDGRSVLQIPIGLRGLDMLRPGVNLCVIGEAGWKWDLGSASENGSPDFPGRFGLGGWRHDGTFARFDFSAERGAGGIYAVFDQLLMREYDDETGQQGIDVFVQFGHTSRFVSAIEDHYGTGLTWTGAIPGCDSNSLGIGISWVGLTNRPRAAFTEKFELATELFDSLQITDHMAVLFDLQQITNPGGLRETRDATVGTLRFIVTF